MNRRYFAPIVLAAAAALGLAGCSGSSSPAKSSSGTGPATTSSASSSGKSGAAAAIAQVMAASDNLPALASAKGTITSSGTRSQVTAEVLQVKDSPQATLVIWRLRSASASPANTKSFQFARPPLFDTRLLGVVDPASKKTYRPYTYVPAAGNGEDIECVCSTLPDSVDSTGTVMYAVLPPLPNGVATVDVTLPGFAAMNGVKVSS